MVESGFLIESQRQGRPETAERNAPGGRERILAVARAAFVERGYADVSMQAIADDAGLTKAAIYYHFRDKEALFESVLVEEVDRLSSGVAAQLAAGPPLRGQIERVAHFAFTTGRGDFGRLLDDAHRYCGHDRLGLIRIHIESAYTMIRNAFAEAQATGEIRDVNLDLTVSLYLSMIAGQLKAHGPGPAIQAPPDVLARAVAEMVMRGIGRDSGRA